MLILLRKNIWNIVFLLFILLVIGVPGAKAVLIRGMMELGLFKPEIEAYTKKIVPVQLKGIIFGNAKGERIDLGNLQGKVIFLNFWATWCPPCRAELPSLNKLHKQFSRDKDVVFIFVDADGHLNESVPFIHKRKYTLPVYQSVSQVPEQIFAGSLPTTVIFDKQGRLSFKHEGVANYDDPKFIDFLNKLKYNN